MYKGNCVCVQVSAKVKGVSDLGVVGIGGSELSKAWKSGPL